MYQCHLHNVGLAANKTSMGGPNLSRNIWSLWEDDLFQWGTRYFRNMWSGGPDISEICGLGGPIILKYSVPGDDFGGGLISSLTGPSLVFSQASRLTFKYELAKGSISAAK